MFRYSISKRLHRFDGWAKSDASYSKAAAFDLRYVHIIHPAAASLLSQCACVKLKTAVGQSCLQVLFVEWEHAFKYNYKMRKPSFGHLMSFETINQPTNRV